MNKTLKVSLFLAAAVVSSAVSSFAQTSGRVSVKVPFEFTAGTTTLPAGEYNFQEDASGVVYISSAELHKAIVVLTNAEPASTTANPAAVRFEKTGEQYSLTEIDLLGEPARRVIKLDHDSAHGTTVASKIGMTNSAKKSIK